MLSFGDTVRKETHEGEPAWGAKGRDKALSAAAAWALPTGRLSAKGTIYMLSCEEARITQSRLRREVCSRTIREHICCTKPNTFRR